MKPFTSDHDTAESESKKRGRPNLGLRRAALEERIGADKVNSMDAEAGKPVEKLSEADFVSLYDQLVRERSWPPLT